jgi:excisionase family DNA binding protein
MAQVARELQISRSTAYLMASDGSLPVVKIRGRLRVVRAALNAQLARQLEEAAASR